MPRVDIGIVDAVLLVGLAARLTRLVVVDTIADPARGATLTAAHRVAGARGLRWTNELLGCPHCAGFWISVAVVASWLAWGDTIGWQAVALAFTLAYVAGHLTARFDGSDGR